MQLGMIGLGRMGVNMVRRLMNNGHDCVVYDVSQKVVQELSKNGATGSSSLDDFVAKLKKTSCGLDDDSGGLRGWHDQRPGLQNGEGRHSY